MTGLHVDAGPSDLLVVVGPTASGKSALALDLAEQKNGEIISADSVQVYRLFDVGSGKPDEADKARARHHLIDSFEPNDPVDAMKYARLAEDTIDDVRSRGKVPIVCGGTFLWVRALLHGLAPMPAGDPAIRARLAAEAEEVGRLPLHHRLRQIDPATAARISPNDFVRVSRALEVFELTGRPLSAWQEEHGFKTERYRAKMVGIRWSNADLGERIATRTRRFLAAGWIDEVRELVRLGHRGARAMSSVGYRQVLAHVEGTLAESDLGPAIDRATRVFARRQRTWLRDEPVHWLDPGDLRALKSLRPDDSLGPGPQ
jgi:tRNA dimethylallyltransferase